MRAGDFSASDDADPRSADTGSRSPATSSRPTASRADGRAIANLYTQMEALAALVRRSAGGQQRAVPGRQPVRLPAGHRPARLPGHAESARDGARRSSTTTTWIAPYGTFIDSQLPTSPTNRRRPGRNYQFGHTWTVSLEPRQRVQGQRLLEQPAHPADR